MSPSTYSIVGIGGCLSSTFLFIFFAYEHSCPSKALAQCVYNAEKADEAESLKAFLWMRTDLAVPACFAVECITSSVSPEAILQPNMDRHCSEPRKHLASSSSFHNTTKGVNVTLYVLGTWKRTMISSSQLHHFFTYWMHVLYILFLHWYLNHKFSFCFRWWMNKTWLSPHPIIPQSLVFHPSNSVYFIWKLE